MSHEFETSQQVLIGPVRRLLLLGLGLSVAVVFVMALVLKPDPRGFGTHQQLGLPDCRFRFWTGLNCPHCGLTTSFCHLVRGQLSASFRANSSGIVLAVLLLAIMFWCLAVSCYGRWLLTDDPSKWFIRILLVFVILNGLLWLIRML